MLFYNNIKSQSILNKITIKVFFNNFTTLLAFKPNFKIY